MPVVLCSQCQQRWQPEHESEMLRLESVQRPAEWTAADAAATGCGKWRWPGEWTRAQHGRPPRELLAARGELWCAGGLARRNGGSALLEIKSVNDVGECVWTEAREAEGDESQARASRAMGQDRIRWMYVVCRARAASTSTSHYYCVCVLRDPY